MRDALGRAFHHIVVGCAVHVDIEHGRRKQCAWEFVMLVVLRETVASGTEAMDEAVFDKQPGVGQNSVRQQHGSGGQQTTHADSFAR